MVPAIPGRPAPGAVLLGGDTPRMGGKSTKVLLVEAETAERERLGDLLERAGFDVVECPGPSGPDYTCVGGREGRCALVEPADIVVLDLWLESDTMLCGTQSGELIGLYWSTCVGTSM